MKYIITIIAAVAVLLLGNMFLGSNTSLVGSIDDGGAYNSTSTSYVWAAIAKGKNLKIGSGILGSVIIGNATAVGTLDLYDATSTDTLGVYGTSTRLIGRINTATVGSTFIYDSSFSLGLLAISSADLATSTITYK